MLRSMSHTAFWQQCLASTSRIIIAASLLLLLFPIDIVHAAPTLTVTPLTFNVVGLDSNNTSVGPNLYPVGARVCNTGTTDATNLTSQFNWVDSANSTYIYLNPASDPAYTTGITLAAGACKDYYYEIEIARTSSSYDKTRRYTISFNADGGVTGVTPTPREIYVEHLVSQNRNSVTDIQVDGHSYLPGETITLQVGNTYNIKLVGKTATGYNELESYIGMTNTVFRINSVYSTYGTVSLAPSNSTLLYADSCGWDNDPTSPTYRSCIVSDGKSGGIVTTTYNVTVISGAGTTEKFVSSLYDFSGSSYHYNADLSTSVRYVSITSPFSISKTFPEKSVPAGSSTPLQISLTNNGINDISGITFTDPLPAVSGSQMTVASPSSISYSSGCLSGTTLTAVSGSSALSFSGGIQVGSTCTVSVNVNIPATPVTATYTNTTNNVFLNGVDTGLNASANLSVASQSSGSQVCTTNATIATWTMPDTTNPPRATNYPDALASATSTITTSVSQVDAAYGDSWSGRDFANSNTLVSNEYFEFSVTTTGYSNIKFSFDAYNYAGKGPQSIDVWYSFDGTTYTKFGSTVTPSTTGFAPVSTSSTGLTNSTGSRTYFRIYAYNPKNPGNSDLLYLDNIKITGDICLTPVPPRLTKTFSPTSIAPGQTSTLSFGISNPNGISLAGVNFTDSLPSGLTFSGTATSPQCGGTVAAVGTSFSFTGGTLAANGSCTITVQVTGMNAGTYLNSTGFISADHTGTNTTATGSGSATLSVLQPLTFSKNFSPNPIYANEVSTLTFSITNPNGITLTGVGFTDTLPGTMVLADPVGMATSSCNSDGATPSVTAVAGTNSVQLHGASVAAGNTCTVTVRVTSASTGDFLNTTDSFTTDIPGLSVDPATDTLSVISHYPGIKVTKLVSQTSDGPWSSTINVGAGSDVYYRIEVENIGDVTLGTLSVSDSVYSLSSCKWPASLPAASPTQDPTVSCVIGPYAAAVGGQLNAASASGYYNSVQYSDSSAASYAISDLSLTKTAAQTSFANVGDVIDYTYTLTNNGSAALALPASITDNRAVVTCPSADTSGNNDGSLDIGESIVCTAAYQVAASDLSTGLVTNRAVGTVDGVNSNAAYATVYADAPDLVVTKTNDTGDYGTQGTAFNWTIIVKNLGPVAAQFTDGQSILSDPLPANASYPATVSTSNETNISGTVSCVIDGSNQLTCSADGDVAIGASTGSFSVVISVNPTASATLVNTAAVDPEGNVSEANEANNTAQDTVYVSSSAPALSLKKSASPTSYIAAGSVISYSYLITNTGSTTFTGPFSVADDKATVTCPSGGLAPLESMTCSANYTITQGDMDAGSVTNVATASANGTDSNPDSVTVTAAQDPEIHIVKSSTATAVTAADQVISYQFAITNPGNISLHNIVVSDTNCDVSPTYLSGDASPTGVLDVGEEWIYTCSHTVTQAEVNAGGNLSNTAYVDSDETGLDSSSLDIPVNQSKTLTLTKTATETAFNAVGDTLHFKVTAENTGNVTLTGVSVTDSALTDLACTPTQPLTLLPGEKVECTGTYTVVQADLEKGSYINYATAAGTAPLGENVDASAQKEVPATQSPDMSLEKTAAESSYAAVGDLLHFTVTAKNTGNVTLTSVSIQDSQLTDLSCLVTQPVDLAPGESLICSGTYAVTQSDLDTGSYTNNATATGNPPVGDALERSAQLKVNAARIASLGVAKRVSSGPTKVEGKPGTWAITFEILVKNTGNVTLTDLNVEDDLNTAFNGNPPMDPPTTFTIMGVSSSQFAVNYPSGYDGITQLSLLQGTDTLVPGAQGTIEIQLEVVPALVADISNSATATAKDGTNTITDVSQNGTDPDPDHDGDPTDNDDPTPISFTGNIFEPPSGLKEVNTSQIPVLTWTMTWMNNQNVTPLEVMVYDPIPESTTYIADFVDSGVTLPLTALTGSTTLGVTCLTNGSSTTEACYYEPPTASYPRGRVIWQGILSADYGVTDFTLATNSVKITFATQMSNGASSVSNVAYADADLNGNETTTDAGEQKAATAVAGWIYSKTKDLPATGFAPNGVTQLPAQPKALSYSAMEGMWIEIPSLNMQSTIVGVPSTAAGWNLTWIGKDTGWLNGSAFPTHEGNSVLTGHVVDANGNPGPFSQIMQLSYGDRIIIHAWGQQYVYEVREAQTVSATDTATVFKHETLPWITLLTCRDYDAATGQYLHRYFVRAVLIKVQ